jgi:protoporphyrinogen oxidase
MSKDVDVFVVGAGPAGLTAAYCLTKENPSVLVIEKDPAYVGGISRTVRYKDFMFDIGGHRFFSKSKEVVDLWREILPDDFIERPRLAYFLRRQVLFVSAERVRGIAQLRPLHQRRMYALIRIGESAAYRRRAQLP